MPTNTLSHRFFFILLALVSVLMFFVFQPYLKGIVVAGVFAVIFEPLYRRIHLFVKQKGVAAGLTILITVTLVLIPLLVFGQQITQEALGLYTSLAERDITYTSLLATLESKISIFLPGFSIDLEKYATDAVGLFFNSFGGFFSGTISLFVNFLVGLFAFYYFLKDGEHFKAALIDLSPLRDSHDHLVIDRLKQTVNSVLKGTLVIALIQGFIASIGLTLFGVPNPALWGSVAAVAAMVPGVGTALVMAPAVLFLFFSGLGGQALGLLLWAVLAVGLIDNILGPKIMSRGIKIHPLFIILSVLGGVTLFGPFGFLFGPLILSVFFALFDIYRLIIKNP